MGSSSSPDTVRARYARKANACPVIITAARRNRLRRNEVRRMAYDGCRSNLTAVWPRRRANLRLLHDLVRVTTPGRLLMSGSVAYAALLWQSTLRYGVRPCLKTRI